MKEKLYCATRNDTRRHPIFLGLFYKSAKSCFYCECTQIKANLLQGVASTVRMEIKKSMIAQAPHLYAQLCSMFIIKIKNNQSNIWGKNTLLSLNIQ